MQYSVLLICHPGFEEEAERELLLKFNLRTSHRLSGGLELESTLEEAFLFNYFMKTVSRVLLRIGEFRARDFPKFYKKIKQLPLKDYFWTDSVDIKVSLKQSRLIHSEKARQTAKKALHDYLRSNVVSPKILQAREGIQGGALYIRGVDDNFTVSVDLSGELLHKRYGHKIQSEASIRETLCASILLRLKTFSKNSVLWDPMCGSGTSLRESLVFHEQSDRSFAFHNFPFIEKTAFDLARVPSTKSTQLYSKVYGNDLDISKAASNLKDYPVKLTEKNFLKDSFDLDGKVDVFLNPPYDKRIKVNEKSFYKKIVLKLFENSFVETCALLVPRDRITEIPKKLIRDQVEFRNGGIPLYLTLLKP